MNTAAVSVFMIMKKTAASQFLQNAAYHSTRRHVPQYSILPIHRCEQFKLQRLKAYSEPLATQYLILQPAITGISSSRFMRSFPTIGKIEY
jgi:hypothetical protein